MMAQNTIELVDLTKKYRSFTAVDHLNLTVRKGEIFGLLGPNGAGKSTTILMMLGLTEPTSGSATVCGIDATRHPIEVKQKVGYLPEDLGFYDDLTGLDNLLFTARLNRVDESEAHNKAKSLLERVGLSDAMNKKAGKYSRGMRQRLGLADVLIKNPQVIILDEPTSGIDPQGVKAFLDLISELRNEQGLTILFSSHHLHQVEQVCDRVGIFLNGKLLANGDIPSLTHQLFTENRFVVEIKVSNKSNERGNAIGENDLKKLLNPIEELKSIISFTDGYRIESSRDCSAEIAQSIVQAGLHLHYLNKKEFGIEDIYNHYFEGGSFHG